MIITFKNKQKEKETHRDLAKERSFYNFIAYSIFVFTAFALFGTIIYGGRALGDQYAAPWAWTTDEPAFFTHIATQTTSAGRLQEWLQSKNSPMADYADILVKQPSWKLIVAIAGAESSWCKNMTPLAASYSQCWGVGGTTPWNFGPDLAEGIPAMQRFLDNFPNNSSRKYRDWSVDELNGFYKQPATNSWAVNVYRTLHDLDQF